MKFKFLKLLIVCLPSCYSTTFESAVNINAVNAFGEPVECTVSIFKKEDAAKARDYAKLFFDNHAKNLPYGVYSYTLTPKDQRRFVPLSGKMAIFSENVFLTAQFQRNYSNSTIDSGGFEVHGTIHSKSGTNVEGMWLVLISPYSGTVASEATIGPHAVYFLKHIVNMGNYVLALCKPGSIVATRAIQIRSGSLNRVDIAIN